jgi:hypothetical protein
MRDGSSRKDALHLREAMILRYMYFITTDEYLGTGFLELEKWDEIFVLFGGSALYIIRPVDKHFKFLGQLLRIWLHER